MMELNVTKDLNVMMLAHPLRCLAAEPGALDMFKQMLGPVTWASMEKAFRSDGLSGTLMGELAAKPEHASLKRFMHATGMMSGGTEVGNAYSTLLFLRHAVAPQPYFVVADELVELLEKTDIADDVPMSALNLPYSRFYVEFGKKRTCSLMIPNVTSGQHRLEGGYLERGTHPDHGQGIYVMFTGSPLGKRDAMDDATHSLFLPASDPDMPIREALMWMYQKANELSSRMGYRVTPSSFVEPSFEALMLLTKVLLYIGLPAARKEIHKDRSEWLKSFGAIKSTAKKAKAERRGRGLVDHILVCAPPPRTERAGTSETGRTLESHWRRGHYRMQPHGPQMSLRKLIFLQPMFIYGTGPSEAPSREYHVA